MWRKRETSESFLKIFKKKKKIEIWNRTYLAWKHRARNGGMFLDIVFYYSRIVLKCNEDFEQHILSVLAHESV